MSALREVIGKARRAARLAQAIHEHDVYGAYCACGCHRFGEPHLHTPNVYLAGAGEVTKADSDAAPLTEEQAQIVSTALATYTAQLAGGEELYGIIAAETGNSLVLKLPDGKTRTLLRSNIDALHSANLSLMPEGLEAGMSTQDLADIIRFLQTP